MWSATLFLIIHDWAREKPLLKRRHFIQHTMKFSRWDPSTFYSYLLNARNTIWCVLSSKADDSTRFSHFYWILAPGLYSASRKYSQGLTFYIHRYITVVYQTVLNYCISSKFYTKISHYDNVEKSLRFLQKMFTISSLCPEAQNKAVSTYHPWDVCRTKLESTCGKFSWLDGLDLERHTCL